MTVAINDCLSLFPLQALNRQPLESGWRMAVATLGEGEDLGFAQPELDDDHWAPIQVPRLHGATAGHESIWYRVRFPRPRHRQRTLLRFEGAFLSANVWLNGKLLGSHYGYFAPFSFDISSFLQDENVLAVCVEAPVELDLAAKRHVMGLFADWDHKPYPSRELGRLPEEFVWHVPMGLWQPVVLEQVGHVVVEWIHCQPRLERADVARLALKLRLRNLDGRIMTGDLSVQVEPETFQGRQLAMRRAIRLNGHEVQDVSMELAIPEPRLWWPASHGGPALYRAQVDLTADERPSAALQQTFGIRDLHLAQRVDGWAFEVNGRPVFLRGATYCSEFFLDAATADHAERDLRLAAEANMNTLRVHGHLEPPALYDLADRAGVLIWQDFPLVFSYVHRSPERATEFFREAVLTQVEEMVHLLYNHPAVACFALHHEPAWCASSPEHGERNLEQLNRDVDEEAATLTRRLDPTRPVLVASGDQDDHLRVGPDWRSLDGLAPLFVSELGVPALPTPNSPVWRHLNRSWPIADDDPSWRFGGFDLNAFLASGVGPPSAHSSREAYIRLTQDYQALVLRYAIERLRSLKLSPCGGVLVFQLVDCFPGLTPAILDHARRPKRAYHAVAQAFAATILVADLPAGDAGIEGLLLCLPKGRVHRFRIICVNDDPGRGGRARLHWRLTREQGGPITWVRRMAAGLRRQPTAGTETIMLPGAMEPAMVVAEPVLRLNASGLYRLSAELELQGTVIAQLDQRFLVGVPRPEPLNSSAPSAPRAELMATPAAVRR
jgi:beta-mannosidase